MREVLITGGLGFIGSNFIHYALKNHPTWKILNVDAEKLGANRKNLADIPASRSYRFIKANVADPKSVARLVRRAEWIIHFAAETHVDRSISNPTSFLKSNVLGTVNLLEAARRADVKRFVHISTDEVYGSAPAGSSYVEGDRLDASSPYAASKASADLYVQAYHRTYGLNTVTLRCTNNFGPYQFPEKFIPKTIISGLLGRKVPIYGDGKQIRDWIFVEDFCRAVVRAGEKGEAGAVYNVSANNEISNLTVANLILEQLRKPSELLEFVADRPGHDFRYSLNSDRIRRELGWKPSHNFQDELRNTVDWYVRNEWWWKPLITGKVLSAAPWKEKW